MAVKEVQPLVMKDVELIIGAGTDDYRKHVAQVEMTPSSSAITWTGLGRNSHTAANESSWTLVLRYVQDWDTTDSLSRYLYENEGETVPVEFRPRSGVGPSFEAEMVVIPGAIGGQVNSFAETSVTLGLNGRPTLVPGV